MKNSRCTEQTKTITKSMREWCRILSAGGHIKGWPGVTVNCSAQNAYGCPVRIKFTTVENLVHAGLIEWEEYYFSENSTLKRTRAVLTEAGHREAAAT